MNSEFYRLRIRLQPVSEISSRESLPSRNFYPTSGFISGKKVRGAFLTAIRREMMPNSEAEQEALSERKESRFLEDAVKHFLKAAPALPESKTQRPREVPNAPYTFLRCKACEDTRKDSALYDGTPELLEKGDLSHAPFCDKHTQPYFRKGFTGPICLSSRRPLASTEINTRPSVTIDGATGSAQPGGLFFTQTVTHRSPLVTEVTVSSGELVDMIKDMQKTKSLLYLGAGRARGWGMAEINAIESEQTQDDVVREEEALLHDVIETYGGFVLIATSGVASIGMNHNHLVTSPCVPEVEGFKLELAYGRISSYTGWSMLTNLQKPLITAANEGSVFFYRVEDISDVDYSRLVLAELNGIGSRLLTTSQMNQVVFWEETE